MKIPQHTARTLLHVTLVVLVVALVVSCGKKQEAAVVGLATVDGDPVSEAIFRHWWGKKTPGTDTPESRRELLDRLIERRALAGVAREAGLLDDPIVQSQIENVLIGRLRETQLAPKLAAVEVSDEQVGRYYAEHRAEKFTFPASVRAAVLWLDTHGREPMVARYTPQLEAIRGELADNPEAVPAAEGFGKFALSNTEHRATRYKGGDLGWIDDARPLSDFHAAVRDIAIDLHEPGELSAVTARPEGLFLVRLIGRKENGFRPLADAREKIETQLLAARRAEIETAFKADVLNAVGIERFDDRLLALDGLAQPQTKLHPGFGPGAVPQQSTR